MLLIQRCVAFSSRINRSSSRQTDWMAQDTDAFTQKMDERAMQLQIQELVCYIWDNYLQLWDNVDEIFLMGVGFAYLGVKLLLISRGMRSLPSMPQDGLLNNLSRLQI